MPDAHIKHILMNNFEWPVEVLGEYLGLSPSQIESLAPVTDSKVNRNDVEKRLLMNKQASLEMIALAAGIPHGVLKIALEEGMPDDPPPIDLSRYASDDCYLLPQGLIDAWIDEVLPQNKIWGSLGSRARELAEKLYCDTVTCAVSEYFGEEPRMVATVRCIATWEYVSRAHQEYVDNGKNISLEPDHIGWHALYREPDLQSRLYRTDLTNLIDYVRSQGRPWPLG